MIREPPIQHGHKCVFHQFTHAAATYNVVAFTDAIWIGQIGSAVSVFQHFLGFYNLRKDGATPKELGAKLRLVA